MSPRRRGTREANDVMSPSLPLDCQTGRLRRPFTFYYIDFIYLFTTDAFVDHMAMVMDSSAWRGCIILCTIVGSVMLTLNLSTCHWRYSSDLHAKHNGHDLLGKIE